MKKPWVWIYEYTPRAIEVRPDLKETGEVIDVSEMPALRNIVNKMLTGRKSNINVGLLKACENDVVIDAILSLWQNRNSHIDKTEDKIVEFGERRRPWETRLLGKPRTRSNDTL